MPLEDELYQQRILDHYDEPFHRGNCPAATHAHEDENPLCGDLVRIELAIEPDGTVRDAYFRGDGCCISQAAASMLLEKVSGLAVDDIKSFTAADMITLFGRQAHAESPEVLPLGLASFAISDLLADRCGTMKRAGPTLDVAHLRADFPILTSVLHADAASGGVPLVYLDNAASTQRPRQVIDSIVQTYERHYANVHRGIHSLSDQSTDRYEAARDKVRALINATAREEIIFTRGTTEGINLVARSWGEANLKAGDEILLSEMEHHANIVPWHQAAARTGAVVRFLPITDDGRLNLDALPQFLTERTRIVALTAVSNVLGTVNPLGKIIPLAHAAGAVVLVDAAQSAPHQAIDVQTLGADFLAFSGHKMLGPTGVGVLYGRCELLDAMPPFLGGGSMIRKVTTSGFEPAELPAKFEAGTPPIVSAIGLGAAIDYLQAIGIEAVAAHERTLAAYAHELLSSIEGLKFLGPPPEFKSGIVSFTLDRIHAHDIAQLFDRQGIAIRAGHHCAMPLHKRLGITASSRASFYLYNTRDEVEKLARALEETKRLFKRK